MFHLPFLRRINCAHNFSYKVHYCHSSQFRQKFESVYGHPPVTAWFPGHMYRGMLQLQAKLAVVDCIIEVHDARVIPLAVELIKNSDLYNRGNRSSFSVMIIGIPNVGKSSLINRLRNYHLNQKSASAVGPIPGVTKSVLEKIKVSHDPCVYLFDSPGIVQPNITSLEVGLKLGLCRTLKDDHTIGLELIADYLLYWLNKHKNFRYVDYLKLKEPTDDIRYLLVQIAKEQNKVKKINDTKGSTVIVPHIEHCSMHFLHAFRQGMFGRVLLDVDYLQGKNT